MPRQCSPLSRAGAPRKRAASVNSAGAASAIIRREVGSSSRDGQPCHVKIVHTRGRCCRRRSWPIRRLAPRQDLPRLGKRRLGSADGNDGLCPRASLEARTTIGRPRPGSCPSLTTSLSISCGGTLRGPTSIGPPAGLGRASSSRAGAREPITESLTAPLLASRPAAQYPAAL